MKQSLEQQLIDKCKELEIELNISDDGIWMDLTTNHIFGTNGETWEHCVVRDEHDWHSDQRINGKNGKRYNYKTEYNSTIKIMLDAINTLQEGER
jgi:hypothetical protein